MRRGHSGIGGWRSDIPRHFRPRGGGQSHYRPPRNYGMPDVTRFPPPGPGSRLHRPTHYGAHTDEYAPHDHHDRKPYRGSNHSNTPQRSQDRGRYQSKSNMRQNPSYSSSHVTRHKENHGNYIDNNYYHENQSSTVNDMGDIDHRQQHHASQNHNNFSQNTSAIWNNNPPNNRQYYENRSPQKSYRYQEPIEAAKIPPLDYPGHRPPASDYYGSTPTVTTNNNKTAFSRSVDDTVDIVRKRLMNRSDPQNSPLDLLTHETHNVPTSETYPHQNIQPEQPPKRRTVTPKPTVKSNCDKMKNKIVHQLFKMDKDKIHKLMDNPNSSTKFEYAISSLITESQNSLNRHLRSIAEKSLCSTSEDFINDDNNTIYEDTFMKQMQCILDPQDTILLEDIKPLVMAELTKVLQLEDVDQTQHNLDNNTPDLPNLKYEKTDYPESYLYGEYSEENLYNESHPDVFHDQSENSRSNKVNSSYEGTSTQQGETEKHQATKISHQALKRSPESRQSRKSIDSKPVIDDIYNISQDAAGLFNISCDQLSEGDDPFDELDKQYHVAVDPTLIEADDFGYPQANTSTETLKENNPTNNSFDELDEFYTGLHNNKALPITPQKQKEIKKEKSTENISSSTNKKFADSRPDDIPKAIEQDKKEPDKTVCSTNTAASSTNVRKRSIDQKPSHRKEKRKKSESCPPDNNKNITNKLSYSKVIDQAIKNTEICEDNAKSICNTSLSKNQNDKEIVKETKKVDSVDKNYSEKYVKRKESRRKSEGSEKTKKRTTSTSSHPTLSPKENIAASTGQTNAQQEGTKKLKTIDMFMKKPKMVNFHQAHRNTASIPSPVKNAEQSSKPKTPVTNNTKDTGRAAKRLLSKETQTFESKSSISRFSQTEKTKFVVKCIQTEPVTFERPKAKSQDTLERMKEIDLEIQVLLQEKFQLYSSLESKDSSSNAMQNLGMTVLNVPLDDEAREDDNALENVLSEDTIVDDFTNIPVEELEQIALETVQEEENVVGRYEKRTRRLTQKLLEQQRTSSLSPSISRRSNKKVKTPNISLLEQIITDDRPLEDIIVLDELETTPVKTTRRKQPKTHPIPRRKIITRTKPIKPALDFSSYELKECSVVLNRNDLTPYLHGNSQEVSTASESIEELEFALEPELTDDEQEVEQTALVVEDAVVNDIQFDMLDVSEDIIIGDNSENNSRDRDISERIPINEDIILQSSQSSSEDVVFVTETSPECRMYDYSTDENLRRDSVTVTGNGDAVLAIECIENNFIAACLDGNVYHFSGDGQLLNTLRGSNLAVTCLTIVKEKHGTTVYTGSLDSRIRYFDLDTGVEKGPECNVLSPIQTMDRAWDTVFVGTRTGFVLQFECKNNMLIPVSTVKFSDQSILALRALKEGPRKVLLVAARSENVTVKDAQTGLLLRTLEGPKMTVYTLLFEDGKVYCGTSSHQIFVFDYVTGGHVGSHEGGKGAVCLRATGGLVFAGCYDGCVYVYREGQTRPLAQLRGPSLMLLSLAVVGSKIIAGYKDRGLYIWKIPLSILQEMIL